MFTKEDYKRTATVCGNEDCSGYGDTTPAQYGDRCMLCNVPQVHWTKIPVENLNDLVRSIVTE